MNGYATHELATIRQQELIGEANRYRLAKEARLAARSTAVPTPGRRLTSLRTAIRMIASRLATPRHSPAGNR